MRIVEEARGKDKKVKYLVEFAGESAPQWADRVSLPLLERWRVKQQCGEEKWLAEYLDLSPENLVGAVMHDELAVVLNAAVLGIQKKLRSTMQYHEKDKQMQCERFDVSVNCAPKVHEGVVCEGWEGWEGSGWMGGRCKPHLLLFSFSLTSLQVFCAMFPEETAAAIASHEFTSVFSTQGFAIALTLEEARELLDPFGRLLSTLCPFPLTAAPLLVLLTCVQSQAGGAWSRGVATRCAR